VTHDGGHRHGPEPVDELVEKEQEQHQADYQELAGDTHPDIQDRVASMWYSSENQNVSVPASTASVAW